MRFAVCDDEVLWVKRISAFISNYYKRMQIVCICDEFTSPSLLIETCKTTNYDVVFLDVAMPQNGIDVASEIRKISPRTMSVFISSYLEFAKDCFPVKAMGYVLKQEIETFLPERLNALLLELKPPESTISLNIEGENISINLSEVQYFSANEHYVTIFENEKGKLNQKASITLSGVEQKLINKPFLRIHKSYIVNMKYISNFKNYKVILKSDIVLPVSETRFSKIRDEFLLWRGANL